MTPSLRSKANCLLSRPNAWVARPSHPSAECELIPGRGADNRDSAASIWMLTLALFVWLLICSLITALLATHFGWLATAKALVWPGDP